MFMEDLKTLPEPPEQEPDNLLNICDVFDLKPCWTFPDLMDGPLMEVIVSRIEVCVRNCTTIKVAKSR